MAISLVSGLVMARLLAPGEYGVSVLGAAVMAVAEAIRALGGGAYLIQKKDLSTENIQSSFTVNMLVTIVLTSVLLLSSGPITRYFLMPDLGRYVQVTALGYLTGPFVYPMSALMSRQMAFGKIAVIAAATALVNAATGIFLAILGYSFMSFAWASAVSAVASMLLYFYFWGDRSIFRPVRRGWRSVVSFGAHDSATAVLSQVAESLPYFMFGRLLDAAAVGLCQRAVMLCLFPERVILAGVGAVALPAFSRQVQEGRSLKHDYLRAIELITAAQWPALLVLVLLAGPIVAVLLGPQWREVVPLVEILGTALLFSFPVSLHYPTLVASGFIRLMPPLVVVQGSLSLGILYVAVRQGLHAAALSMLLIVPLNALISMTLARFAVGFRWAEVIMAIWRSAICAAMSAAGPAAILVATGVGADMPIMVAILAGGLAGGGWIGGLWMTNHPLLHEGGRLAGAVRRRLAAAGLGRIGARLRGR
jgi:O-antigen/teichoic acid export membrane protein